MNPLRVCAQCEREFGLQPVEPGRLKSHGLCRRHAIEAANEYLENLKRRGDDYFAPDLGEHKEAA